MSSQTPPNNPKQKPGWALIFNDEFTSNSLQSGAGPWMPRYPWGPKLRDDELQYYTSYDKTWTTNCDKGGINHIFNSGKLQLVAKQESGNFEVWRWDKNVEPPKFYTTCDPYNYTSGMIFCNQQPFLGSV